MNDSSAHDGWETHLVTGDSICEIVDHVRSKFCFSSCSRIDIMSEMSMNDTIIWAQTTDRKKKF